MTDAVLQAIKGVYDNSTTLKTALPGGYAALPATEFTVFKTLIVELISAPSKQVYGTAQDGDYRIRFTTYAVAGDAISLLEQVASVFHVPPDLSGFGMDCSCVNQSGDVIPNSVPQKDEQGNEIWGAFVDLIFSVHKP